MNQQTANSLVGRGLATVRHALPGEPIEIIITINGRETRAQVGDLYALSLAEQLLRGARTNATAKARHEELKDQRRYSAGPDTAGSR